ncbi:Os07g0575366 [Oryza sativa Japonica Group]|nr:Os07g0575366 [Oryza sativa Japonica Group]
MAASLIATTSFTIAIVGVCCPCPIRRPLGAVVVLEQEPPGHRCLRRPSRGPAAAVSDARRAAAAVFRLRRAAPPPLSPRPVERPPPSSASAAPPLSPTPVALRRRLS